MLNNSELQRYNRHIILSEVGKAGQIRLKEASVLVIGAGGLGCPVLQYLTATGIGKIGIVDFDTVALSNLQRQILYTSEDIGKSKAEVAQKKLQLMNPEIEVFAHLVSVNTSNVLNLLTDYQIIVDCTDNFPTRYLLNDACVILDKPLVFGAIFKFEGQVSIFNLKDKAGERGATYRCLFPKMPQAGEVPNCAEAGVIGIWPGIIGTLQANEVIKLILGIGEPLRNKILLFDALTLQTQIIKFKRIEEQANITALGNYEEVCEPIKINKMKTISVQALKDLMDNNASVQLIDVREDDEFEICHIENAQLMPLSEIEGFAQKIDDSKQVIVYCHHGMRSASAINLLEKKFAFQNLYNLEGGIHAWAEEIDEEMEQY
jgi:sulfur-carrier protein adenylyltransferase/sulfurtransferase